MKIIKNIQDLPSIDYSVVTIGGFDGVHLGHQQILRKVRQEAIDNKGTSVVITFSPHPRIVLNNSDNKIKLLNTDDEKAVLINKSFIDFLFIMPFNKEFAATEPETFVKEILVKQLKIKKIILGYDHHFGKDRQGAIDTLQKLSLPYNFTIEQIPEVFMNKIAVSSTKIRNAILNKNMTFANAMLGYRYHLSGIVSQGSGIGKKLGYPTANISINDKNKLLPEPGIYAAIVVYNYRHYKAMLYIGNKPTFDNYEQVIEVHIIDFNQDIYNKYLLVKIVEFIRDDIKFSDTQQLIQQIDKDKIIINEILEDEGVY
ncbi:MAG: bifunctional riboflavin kinase/FAD synthetase [Bacteroidales bacterium]|nr:bifunctional riboflavin kinase/FAD synthetase [Bacteroidales bacterium]